MSTPTAIRPASFIAKVNDKFCRQQTRNSDAKRKIKLPLDHKIQINIKFVGKDLMGEAS